MPIYDYLGGTVDKNSDALYRSVRKGVREKMDFVYLSHGVDVLHMLHVAMGVQSFAAKPFESHWLLWPLYPFAVLLMGVLWAVGKPFVADTYRIPGVRGETWLVPRYRFQVGIIFQIILLVMYLSHGLRDMWCSIRWRWRRTGSTG